MNDFASIASTLEKVGDILAQSNAEAKQVQQDRDWDCLDRLVGKFGICNVVGVLADTIEEKLSQYHPDTNCHADYYFAWQVLDAAARGVDLPYSDEHSPGRRLYRAKAKRAIVQLTQEIL